MFILINGSPTKYFVASRGLRQGDPVSPFLFAIVVEGLAGITRKATFTNLFKEFKMQTAMNVVSFGLLQFADDMIVIGDGSLSNIWAIKSILRAFELVSSLRVNMNKIKLYDIG
ncbi:unnamed protein product [Lathyrus sativus]|nr:unnamed protein product [Lathyrus sativus]